MQLTIKVSTIKSLMIAFLLLIISTTTYGQSDQRSPIIQGVEIQGNNSIDADTILYVIESNVGTRFDFRQVRRDIRAIYNQGFFENIEVQAEHVINGVKLIFKVSERPIITEIAVTGTDKVPLNTVNDEVTVKKGDRFDPVDTKETANKIEKLYRDRGYNFASINTRLIPSGPGSASLVITINEGTKVVIDEIEIIGNDHFSDGNYLWGLKSKMKNNREWSFVSWVSSIGDLKEDILQEDIQKIEEFYKNKGYLQVSVGEPEIVAVDEGKGKRRHVKITIPLTEGEIYRYGKIEAEVADEEIIPAEFIQNILENTRLEKYQKFLGGSAFFGAGPRAKEGKVYSYALEQEIIKNITEIYGSQGYIYVQIFPDKRIDDENHIVDIKFKIFEGTQAYLHRLEFRGNTRTRDRVLRRNILIGEGSIFNTALVKQSISRVDYLGYIDEVEPDIVPLADPSQIDVTIHLNDTKQTEIQLAGGYSDYEGFYGTLGLSEHNLFGRGQSISISATQGKRTESFKLSFADEWIFDRPYYGSLSVWDTTKDYDYSSQRSRGGSVTVGRGLIWNISTRLGYKYERNRVFDIDETASDEIQNLAGEQVTSSMTSIWIRDTLNDRRDPTKGTYSRYYFEYAGKVFGGDNSFYKTGFSWSFYKPLKKNLVFDFRSEINYAHGLDGQSLPFYERFRMGGPRSIRGYEDNSIGPWDEYSQNLGGNKSLLLSTELLIPIAGPLKTVLFIDAGDVYAKNESMDIRTLRPSTGVEIRFTIPGFYIPLRFIWGYNLDPLVDDDRNDFQFTMGTSF